MRALKRAQDERELAAMKQKDVEKLQAEIEDLQQKREELLARIGKYALHNTYLEKVSVSQTQLFEFSTILVLCRLDRGDRR